MHRKWKVGLRKERFVEESEERRREAGEGTSKYGDAK